MLDRIQAWWKRVNSRYRHSLQSMQYAGTSTLDDSLIQAIDNMRRKNRQCVLIVLHIDHYGHMMLPGHYEKLAAAELVITYHIKRLLPEVFPDEQCIGIRNFHGEQYGIFLVKNDSLAISNLQDRVRLLSNELVLALRADQSNLMHGTISFGSGYFQFEKEPHSTRLAVSIAYRYAEAMAIRKLPDNFAQFRKELLDIVNGERIEVLAQPIMDLRTGDIFGWEMLTRGPHQSPYYKPAELFEFAYQTELLPKLELIVFKKAFAEIVNRHIHTRVFINVTSVSLTMPQFYEELIVLLKSFPAIEPRQIVLELTERHLISDYALMAATMNKYRSLGFKFALDDTGAGYASLQSIFELIPDMIKIDRSLVQNIDQGSVKKSLLKAIMQFAQEIECEVIAEGIEREEEADVIVKHSVTKAQGYYYAKPEPLVYGGYNAAQLQQLRDKIRFHEQPGNYTA